MCPLLYTNTIILLAFVVIFRTILKRKKFIRYFFIFLIILIIFSLNKNNYETILYENNRMLVLLENILGDASFIGRQRHMIEGFNDILENFFIGKLFVGVLKDGQLGEYIHNIFSYWAEFGLIPFIILFYLNIKYSIVNIKYIFKNKEENYLLSILSLFSILVCLISRSYIYPYLWLGLSISIYNTQINEKSKNSNCKEKDCRGVANV